MTAKLERAPASEARIPREKAHTGFERPCNPHVFPFGVSPVSHRLSKHRLELSEHIGGIVGTVGDHRSEFVVADVLEKDGADVPGGGPLRGLEVKREATVQAGRFEGSVKTSRRLSTGAI